MVTRMLDLIGNNMLRNILAQLVSFPFHEPIGRYLGCEHRVLEALIPAGGNPSHGCIPEPPPKSKTRKRLSEDDEVRAIQLQQRSETKKRNIDYGRTNTPSGENTNVRIMLYDMKHSFMGCESLSQSGQTERIDL